MKDQKQGNENMNEEYKIVNLEKPDETAWSLIGGGLHQFNIQQAGDDHGKPLCFVLYAPDQELVGGIIGETHWEWLYVNLMFLREDLRGRGYGQRLLRLAEEEARKRGAKNAYLDTFSFQAPAFYEKQGYEVFGELQEFPPGHQRYYLRKKL